MTSHEEMVVSTLLRYINALEMRVVMDLDDHPNLVNLHGVSPSDYWNPALVESAADDLKTHLLKRRDAGFPVDWATKARFCCDVADALLILHSGHVIHGDVKAEDIQLYPKWDDGARRLSAKIATYGSSSWPSFETRRRNPNYWAPERMPTASPDLMQWINMPTEDVFSFGLFVWQVAMDGEIPYDGFETDLVLEIKNSDPDLKELLGCLPPGTPPEFIKLISGATCQHPQDRIQLTAVKQVLDSVIEAQTPLAKNAEEEATKMLLSKKRDSGFQDSVNEKQKQQQQQQQQQSSDPATKAMTNDDHFLYDAARGGNTDAVKLLLQQEITDAAGATDEAGRTLLHWAAFDGRAEVVAVLADDFHAEANVRDDTGTTPLHLAAKRGHFEVAKMLVTRMHADVNSKDDEGQAPIHLAADSGSVQIVDSLINEFHANVNAVDSKGRTALHAAAKNGHPEVSRVLAACPCADLNAHDKDGWTPLHFAARWGNLDARATRRTATELDDGHKEVLRVLAGQFNADLNAADLEGCTPLHLAVKLGRAEIVKVMVGELHADVNARDNDGCTPLDIAVRLGHADVVKVLASEFRIDMNAVEEDDGLTPLHLAADWGHVEMVQVLVSEFHVDINMKDRFGRTPLHSAVKSDLMEPKMILDTVRVLVGKLNADVNARDFHGLSPLHFSIKLGRLDVAEVLLREFKADVNIKAKNGQTPLHLAVKSRHVDVVVDMVQLLAGKHHADVNAMDENGFTPLHFAVKSGDLGLVGLLVEEYDADVDAKTKNGQTALHFAVKSRTADVRLMAGMARLLAGKFRADVNATDETGHTPLHCAVKSGHLRLVELLHGEFHSKVRARSKDGETPLDWAVELGRTDIVLALGGDFNLIMNAKDKAGPILKKELEISRRAGLFSHNDAKAKQQQGAKNAKPNVAKPKTIATKNLNTRPNVVRTNVRTNARPNVRPNTTKSTLAQRSRRAGPPPPSFGDTALPPKNLRPTFGAPRARRPVPMRPPFGEMKRQHSTSSRRPVDGAPSLLSQLASRREQPVVSRSKASRRDYSRKISVSRSQRR